MAVSVSASLLTFIGRIINMILSRYILIDRDKLTFPNNVTLGVEMIAVARNKKNNRLKIQETNYWNLINVHSHRGRARVLKQEPDSD